jgi:hypothetical protein
MTVEDHPSCIALHRIAGRRLRIVPVSLELGDARLARAWSRAVAIQANDERVKYVTLGAVGVLWRLR